MGVSKKSKDKAPAYSGKVFPIGSSIKLLRPNMHFDLPGRVIGVNADSGEHLIRVTAKNGAEFNASATGAEMEGVK